jgi:signal transduction histidine kinase
MGRIMKTADLAQLIGWGAGTVVVGAIATTVALRLLRRRGLAAQVAVVAIVPCCASLLGAWFGSRAMFFSDHDRTALVVLLVAAGIVGVGAAIAFGFRVAAADHALHAARREQAVEASRSELVAWVSHDLRTPLAGIRAMAEALADGVVHEAQDVRRYHEQLRIEAERLGGLVDDLFELSRAQHGTIAASIERIALDDLVSDAIAGLAPVAAARGVRIIGAGSGEAVELDVAAPEMLRALRNVLENAIRHTPADGSVVVETRRDGAAAIVSICDDGGGIDPAHLERVYEPGFRADPARTPGHAGGGLGLAIARGVVEAHRGAISIANEANGARVTIELPVAATRT